MSIEDNKALARRYLECISRGDVDSAFALVTDDLEHYLPGKSPISGKFDKASVMAAVKALMAASTDGMRIWPIAMIGEGDRVAVQAQSRAQLRDGSLYENEYHLLFECRDGKIIKMYEYLDTQHAMEKLADVLG
jgi:ketosteroid isomerase-like protein